MLLINWKTICLTYLLLYILSGHTFLDLYKTLEVTSGLADLQLLQQLRWIRWNIIVRIVHQNGIRNILYEKSSNSIYPFHVKRARRASLKLSLLNILLNIPQIPKQMHSIEKYHWIQICMLRRIGYPSRFILRNETKKVMVTKTENVPNGKRSQHSEKSDVCISSILIWTFKIPVWKELQGMLRCLLSPFHYTHLLRQQRLNF